MHCYLPDNQGLGSWKLAVTNGENAKEVNTDGLTRDDRHKVMHAPVCEKISRCFGRGLPQ